jgi:putative SOS response-associated peptidase YedK
MIVKIQGKAYFHQLSSQDNAWEYVPAPSKYDDLPTESVEHEVAPTQQVLLHRVDGTEIVPDWAFWTLVPPWTETLSGLTRAFDGSPRLVPPPRTHFNSRKDTLLRSKGWQNLLRTNRCVLFLDGFLEWSDDEMLGSGQKLVGRYELADRAVMPVAGIWSKSRTDAGEILTCSVITCEPNDLLRELPHHRMPAILEGDLLKRWLDPRTPDPQILLKPLPPARMRASVKPLKAPPPPPLQQSFEL